MLAPSGLIEVAALVTVTGVIGGEGGALQSKPRAASPSGASSPSLASGAGGSGAPPSPLSLLRCGGREGSGERSGVLFESTMVLARFQRCTGSREQGAEEKKVLSDRSARCCHSAPPESSSNSLEPSSKSGRLMLTRDRLGAANPIERCRHNPPSITSPLATWIERSTLRVLEPSVPGDPKRRRGA